MRRGDLRRLEKLEVPAEAEYQEAFRRATLRVVRELGAALTDEETALVGGGSDARDAETLRRYRASLPDDKAERERARLLAAAYREAEARGADPWKEDFGKLAEELEARGYDGSGVRWFSE